MSGPADPVLDIAIVSYESRQLLAECLESLAAHPATAGQHVCVVDNASSDGTAEMTAVDFPWVELRASDRNLGFSAGTNLGIRSGKAPYVLALNPDTRVESGTLDQLIELMESKPEVGCCGPELITASGEIDHAGRRSFPNPVSALGHFTGIGRKMGGGALADYRAPDVESGPVDAVNGAFMLIRRSALDQVGLFDEGYWMYMEDLDLSFRLAQAGWITWYEPGARAFHMKGGSAGEVRSPKLNWHFHRGMGRYYRRHLAPDNPAPLNAAVYLGIGAKLAISVVRGAAGSGVRQPKPAK